MWLNSGVSEADVKGRLQARVPDFPMSPDPGGRWNWLIGLLAIGGASAALVLLTRRAVASDPPEKMLYEQEVADHWQERLDDELIRAEQ